MICAFRTNLVLVYILFTVVIGVGLIIADYWYLAVKETALAAKCQIVSHLAMSFFFPCLGIDATNLIFRAEGLYYSQHVSADGIYSFLCCLKLWTFLYGFPWVISLAMSPDYHNLRRGQIDNST